MADRWTNYRKCLYFLRFSNACTHPIVAPFMLMTSLKRRNFLEPVYSHFFVTKTISTIAKTYLALAAFSHNRIVFYFCPQTQNSSEDRTSADKMAAPVAVWFQSPPFHTPSHLYSIASRSSFVSQSQTPRVTNLRLSPARSSLSII